MNRSKKWFFKDWMNDKRLQLIKLQEHQEKLDTNVFQCNERIKVFFFTSDSLSPASLICFKWLGRNILILGSKPFLMRISLNWICMQIKSQNFYRFLFHFSKYTFWFLWSTTFQNRFYRNHDNAILPMHQLFIMILNTG